MTKPRDMLEFFRRTSSPSTEAVPSSPSLEPTTRMLVVRRSQAVVAIVAAVAALLLAFLLGHAVGASGKSEALDAAPEVYVIRAIAYSDDLKGSDSAQRVKTQLERMDLGEEVVLWQVPSESRTVVTVGSWLGNPAGRKEACALRDKLRGVKDKSTQSAPFADADFWRMKR